MKINWQQVATNLRRYKPLHQVAREVGSTETTLNRIARGETKEPKYMAGVKLLDLHYDRFPEKHLEVIS